MVVTGAAGAVGHGQRELITLPSERTYMYMYACIGVAYIQYNCQCVCTTGAPA